MSFSETWFSSRNIECACDLTGADFGVKTYPSRPKSKWLLEVPTGSMIDFDEFICVSDGESENRTHVSMSQRSLWCFIWDFRMCNCWYQKEAFICFCWYQKEALICRWLLLENEPCILRILIGPFLTVTAIFIRLFLSLIDYFNSIIDK